MKTLVKKSHENAHGKRKLKAHGVALFRSLVEAGIVRLAPIAEGGPVRIDQNLQRDFSLHNALSLYVLETLPRVDVESETYALDVLTLVESILENPDVVLMRQVDKIKRDMVAEMKQAGVEYDDRMKKLEEVTYPKPQASFIYDTFNEYARLHPWVGQDNIRPKSIAREMVETFQAFNEYVQTYGLERAEGVLLRYLSEVYKALSQTIPDRAKTEAVHDIVAQLGAIVRGVDSSLLDEWERMRDGGIEARRPGAAGSLGDIETEGAPAIDVTRDARGFRAMIKNDLFALQRALAKHDYAAVLDVLGDAPVDEAGEPWTERRLDLLVREFEAANGAIRTGPDARRADRTTFDEGEHAWAVSHVLADENEHDDWLLVVKIDLERSRGAGRPSLRLERLSG